MPWRPLPSRGSEDQPRRLNESLDRLSRGLGAPPARAVGIVFSGWTDLVGPTLAAHAWPVSLTGGVLVVAVDHPSLATEVRWLAPQLLTRLGELTGDGSVSSVEIRVRSRRP
ncbi:MAG: DciA family protein [Acidimicrobiales bacterium]